MSFLKRNEKLLVKMWNKNWKKIFPTAYQEKFNSDVSFRSISQFLNNFPDLFLFTFSFPKWPLKFNCTFRWQ